MDYLSRLNRFIPNWKTISVMQYSIRFLFLYITYVALGCAISGAAGFEFFLFLNLLLIYITVSPILAIGAMEYAGHKRRFCATALTAVCFLFILAMIAGELEAFIAIGIFGLPIAFFTGLMAAGTYRVLQGEDEQGDCGRVLDFVTRTLAKLLPSNNEL